MTDLSVEDYTERSIVVRGDTKEWKGHLKELGGKYNSRLRDGPGWIFSKRFEDTVLAFVSSGKVPQTERKSFNSTTTSSGIMSDIETHLKSLSLEQRLDFLGKVAMLASTTKTRKLSPKKKDSRKTTKRVTNKTPKPQSDDEIVIESSSEEEPPMKRLLGRH